MVRCAIYDRVSTDIQVTEGISLDAQKSALTEYANANKYKIVDYYTDEGITARKKMQNRKELLRLLEDIKENKIDIVLVTKLDRWFRNIKDYHNTQAILEAHNCNWKTIFEEYDTTTANGRFAINIMLSVNENECDRDSDRIKDVFEYKKRNKEALSGLHASFGYKIVDKHFVKDESVSFIVDDLFKYYFDHFSKRKTIEYIIGKYGDKAPSHWTLDYMFKNKMYTGTVYGIENYCDCYISMDEFNKIKKISSAKFYTNISADTYIFSGLIKCPYCGKNFAGYKHRNKKPSGKEYFYPVYHCKEKKRVKGLCKGGIEIYESAVERYLIENMQVKIEENIIELTEMKKKKYVSVLPSLKKELERLNILYQKGRISDEYYENQYDAVTVKIIEEDKKEKVTSIDSYQKIKKQFADNWVELYRELDKEHKQAFWKSIIEHIEINGESHKVSDFKFLL